MTRVALTGGAYEARSVISSCQRQCNLYSEAIPEGQGEPAAMTNYPTPGLRLLLTLPSFPVRGLYRANSGDLYAVGGATLYVISPLWVATVVGQITPGTSIVSFADNGVTMILVDGTSDGYTVDLVSHAFAQINALVQTGFYGSTRVEYQDTFFICNSPGTPIIYVSGSEAVTFDPLDFASKSAYGDNLVAVVTFHRNLWLIGELTTEVWYNSGGGGSGALTNNTFPFELVPNAFSSRGCCAKYSISRVDNSAFWLSQDSTGAAIVLEGTGYAAKRISTHAIEATISGYAIIGDAIGHCYMQQGHAFYMLHFPSADATWVFDLATRLWHERVWTDGDGAEHRHRANCVTFAYNVNLAGDWQTGAIYQLDLGTFTDAGAPIVRRRSFPHMVGEDFNRVIYRSFTADMAVGDDLTPGAEPSLIADADDPTVYLRWSDDRGRTWSNALPQTMGNAGDYKAVVSFNRLGLGRDRVWELQWSAPTMTALSGAWVDTTPSAA